LADNVAAALIRERQAGIVSSDPAEIAGQLSRWLEAKEAAPTFPTCQRRLRQDYRARNRLVVWSGFWSASSALLR